MPDATASASPPRAAPPWWALDLGYVLLALALFHEVFLGARFIDRDLLHYFFPLGEALSAAWRGGGSLLWDSGVDHGMPLLARWSPAALYPAHWLFAALPVGAALSLALLIHFPLAAGATRRLAGRYTDNPWAAWVAGLAYAFGGYLLSMVGGGTYFYGAALLPLGLLLAHRAVERPTLGRALLLALVLALQVLTPDPQTLYYQVLLLLPVVLLVAAPAGRRLRAALALAGAGGLALGLAFCQLWPTLELSALSVRAAGLSYQESSIWSLHPLRALEYLAPGVLGAQVAENTFWGGALVNGFSRPWATAVHVGLLPLAALLALGRRQPGGRPRPDLWAWAALTALFGLLALGAHTPALRAVQLLPGASNFRYPEKFLLFVSLGLCLLGAAGLGRLLPGAQPRPEPRGWTAAARVVLGLALIAALLLFGRLLVALEPEWLLEQVRRSPTPAAALAATAAALERAAGVALALLAVLLLRRRLRPGLLTGLLLVITTVDLLTAGLPLRLLGGQGWLDRPPALCAALPSPRVGPPPLIWRNPRMVYRGDPPGTPGPSSPAERHRRWEYDTLKANLAAGRCGRYATGYDAGRLALHEELVTALAPHPQRMLDLLGVQRVLDSAGSRPDPLARFPALGVELYKNDGLPHVRALSRVLVAPGPAAARRLLADPRFPLRRTAVVESPRPLPEHPDGRRVARLRRYAPGRMALDLDFQQPGYLALLEAHYPGWQARLDGRPVTLLRVNGAFLGLAAPAGRHRLELTFDPPRQRLANRVSLGAASLWLLLAAIWGLGRLRAGG